MFPNANRLIGKSFRLSSQASRSVFVSSTLAAVLVACGFSAATAADVLQGEDARKASSVTARSIQWETSLDAAEAKAKQNGKPILWVHMLGNVDGYT